MRDEKKIREMIDKMANEPEFIEWKEKGYRCMISRNPKFGNYCGYVGIPTDHPWYGKDLDDAEIEKIEVYGGITYASDNHWRIKVAQGDSVVWWLGFDVVHWYDLTMYDVKNNFTPDGKTYKDFEFMQAEVKKLVRACEEAFKNYIPYRFRISKNFGGYV